MTSTLKTEKIQFRGDNSDAITLASSGKVGIGTTSPSETLHVKGLARIESTAGNAAYMRFVNDVNSGGKIWRAGAGVSAHGTFSIYNQTDNKFGINVHNNGYVNKPNQPAFFAGFSENSYYSVGTTNGTKYKFAPYTNENQGKGYNIGSHYNNSNNRFTAPIAGRYHFAAQFFTNYSSNYMRYGLDFYKNGSVFHSRLHPMWEATGSVYASVIISLAVNDYIEVYVYGEDTNATSNSWNIYQSSQYSWFQGELIG